MNKRNNRSNSAVRSSHNGSVNSARGNQVDYYANVDRLRSVNKLTTLESGGGQFKQKSLSPKVGIPGGISHMGQGFSVNPPPNRGVVPNSRQSINSQHIKGKALFISPSEASGVGSMTIEQQSPP